MQISAELVNTLKSKSMLTLSSTGLRAASKILGLGQIENMTVSDWSLLIPHGLFPKNGKLWPVSNLRIKHIR